MKYAWLTLGCVSLLLGAAGAVLPLLPATPFLLLAAWAFARSSDRFHHWLIGHPVLGPPINAWKTRQAISRKAKMAAMASLAFSVGLAFFMGVGVSALVLQLLAVGAVATFILTRREA